ncbi:MAG: hypothetical protein FJ271_07185 [Planctomycetes bacterium]|nr:hypothetical protein [Planctomycetota bacterium]
MTTRCILGCFLCVLASLGDPVCAGKDDSGITVDKVKKLVKIDAQIAPRKLEYLKGKTYPIEVIACWPYPKGKKAHETVITFEAKPSAIHKAVESLGLKPGTPVMGGKDQPQGPEVLLYLEVAEGGGAARKITIDKSLVDSRNGKPFPKSVRWRFTGSVMSKPDPAKDETVYGADLTGTLVSIFPVTNQTVFQTNLTMEEEKYLKLETNTKNLPKEGTPVKLVIEVAKARK